VPRKIDDDDPKFRLRPGKQPIPRERRSSPELSVTFRAVLKCARSSPVRSKAANFTRNTVLPSALRGSGELIEQSGGRTLAREWPVHCEGECVAGTGEGRLRRGDEWRRYPSELRNWQDGADPRLWKLSVSPEFGERLDWQQLTRDVMSRMESDLHTSLDWVAVLHFNTEHPQVHVALRGLDTNGEEFRLNRLRRETSEGLGSVARQCNSAIEPSRMPKWHLAGRFRCNAAADPTRPVSGRFAAVREHALLARLMKRWDSPERMDRTSGRFGAIWKRR
jgi:hypothetical protein